MLKTIKKTSSKSKNRKINYPELIIHNDIIEGKFNFTSLELKTLLAIALKIQSADKGCNIVDYLKDNDDPNIYYTGNEIGQIIGITKNAFHHFEKILDSLMKTVITIKNPNDEKGWIKLHFLNRAEYKDGIISIKPEKEMLPFYTRITKNYTPLEISTMMLFKSIYSIRVYILIKQYKTYKPFRQFTLESFKEQLGIKNKYDIVRDLKLNVLEPAKKELNALLEGINFEYELLKSGKSYTDIKFSFNFDTIKSKVNVEIHSQAVSCFKEHDNGRNCNNIDYGVSDLCDYCLNYIKPRY